MCMKFENILHMTPTPCINILAIVSHDNEVRARMKHPLEHLPLLFIYVLELVDYDIAVSADRLATFCGSQPRLSHVYELVDKVECF